MEVGKRFTVKTTVNEQNTAIALGSGDAPVFATPMMVALMEGAAAQCVQPDLAEGKTTVGGHIDVSHISATPVGMEVEATATVTAVEGKKITFSVEARDACGVIGQGKHLRFVVDRQRFTDTANAKREK